jgi:uncharacterized protein (DUF2141 family)
MKTVIILLVNFLFTSVLFAQEKGNLTINFNDIDNPKGELFIGIYEKSNFLQQPTIGKIVKVKTEDNQVTFEGLAHGEYAVSVYQDLNANKQFDMDEYGRPAEPWVMSGNVNPNQMPVFEDAKIEFNSTKKTVTLEL